MSTPTLARTPGTAGGTVTLRRGAATFVGSVTAAASGFALAVAVGRGLGAAGAGVFFAIVALFTIASTVLKLGTDTALLWRLPRLLDEGRVGELRPTVLLALLSSTVASVTAVVALVALADVVALRLGDSTGSLDVRSQVLWAAAALVFMAPMTVLVAATRGLGLVKPFVLIQNIGLPLGRLVAVVAVLVLGAGGVAVMAAWSVPVMLAFVLAAYLLAREVRSVLRSVAPRAPARPLHVLATELRIFAAPRGVTASIEVVLVAVNTLVVGMLHGPAAAGAFGALSRFVTSGALAEQAVRILVAPRFSALLAAGELRSTARLHAVTTPWIAIVSVPIFSTLAAGAPVTLSLFGPGFETGAGALAVLSVTMCISQLAGNVQTILLMSGRSDLQLIDKVAAVVVLFALDLALIPRWGLMGAAIAWSASILVDTAMAVAQVRWLVGVGLRSRVLPKVLIASIVAFAVPTVVLVRTIDGGLPGLAAALMIGAAGYLPLLWLWRRQLHLTGLASGLPVEQIELRGSWFRGAGGDRGGP
jgi:O-antigen/teichoic acid export membrane protein